MCVCVCMCAVINSRCLPSVTENANAPDDSGIRAKEARRENRTLRRGACQVSPETPLTKSARMNDGSAIVEQFRYLLPRPIITIAFLPNPNAQANVSEKTYPEDHIYCAFLHFFINTCILSIILCATLYFTGYINSLTVVAHSFFSFFHSLSFSLFLYIFVVSFLSLKKETTLIVFTTLIVHTAWSLT